MGFIYIIKIGLVFENIQYFLLFPKNFKIKYFQHLPLI